MGRIEDAPWGYDLGLKRLGVIAALGKSRNRPWGTVRMERPATPAVYIPAETIHAPNLFANIDLSRYRIYP